MGNYALKNLMSNGFWQNLASTDHFKKGMGKESSGKLVSNDFAGNLVSNESLEKMKALLLSTQLKMRAKQRMEEAGADGTTK